MSSSSPEYTFLLNTLQFPEYLASAAPSSVVSILRAVHHRHGSGAPAPKEKDSRPLSSSLHQTLQAKVRKMCLGITPSCSRYRTNATQRQQHTTHTEHVAPSHVPLPADVTAGVTRPYIPKYNTFVREPNDDLHMEPEDEYLEPFHPDVDSNPMNELLFSFQNDHTDNDDDDTDDTHQRRRKKNIIRSRFMDRLGVNNTHQVKQLFSNAHLRSSILDQLIDKNDVQLQEFLNVNYINADKWSTEEREDILRQLIGEDEELILNDESFISELKYALQFNENMENNINEDESQTQNKEYTESLDDPISSSSSSEKEYQTFIKEYLSYLRSVDYYLCTQNDSTLNEDITNNNTDNNNINNNINTDNNLPECVANPLPVDVYPISVELLHHLKKYYFIPFLFHQNNEFISTPDARYIDEELFRSKDVVELLSYTKDKESHEGSDIGMKNNIDVSINEDDWNEDYPLFPWEVLKNGFPSSKIAKQVKESHYSMYQHRAAALIDVTTSIGYTSLCQLPCVDMEHGSESPSSLLSSPFSSILSTIPRTDREWFVDPDYRPSSAIYRIRATPNALDGIANKLLICSRSLATRNRLLFAESICALEAKGGAQQRFYDNEREELLVKRSNPIRRLPAVQDLEEEITQRVKHQHLRKRIYKFAQMQQETLRK